MRVAAIDIGSNSLLLCIAELERPLKVLFDEAHVTGLSKGLSQNQKISEDRAEKSLAVLRQFRAILSQYRVDQIRVAATEALRRASNGNEIKARIEKVLEAPVDLISGDREAGLSFWSVQEEHPATHRRKIVFDIGGASTEVCLGASHGIDNRVSLKVGSVLLTEKFHLQHQNADPSPALQYVRTLLNDASWTVHAAKTPSLAIGVAGTMTSLLAMEKHLSKYSKDKVHGISISRDRIHDWLKRFLGMSAEERKSIVGLQPERADVFGGGLCILAALTDFFRWSEVTCMDSGVRFGLLYELLREAK